MQLLPNKCFFRIFRFNHVQKVANVEALWDFKFVNVLDFRSTLNLLLVTSVLSEFTKMIIWGFWSMNCWCNEDRISRTLFASVSIINTMGEIVEISQGDIQQNAVNGWGDTMGKIQYWCPEGSCYLIILIVWDSWRTICQNC